MRRQEIHDMIIRAAAKLSDKEALSSILLYDKWRKDSLYKKGERIRHDGKLYRVIQEHTSQEDWIPGYGTASLYEVINITHDGTLDDPIPYEGNMELELGKYYSQEGMVYICTRDTGAPVYHNLADLVGLYVDVVEE